MKSAIFTENKTYTYDTSIYYDISLPLNNGDDNPNCFYLPQPVFTPFKAGDFIGSTSEGGNCNCFTLTISPHGNGTHTECIGHILTGYTINKSLKDFISVSQVVTVEPKLYNGDYIITKDLLESCMIGNDTTSLIVRTLPNKKNKKKENYSGNNPPYFLPDCMEFIREKNIVHLLTDLPSVDREEDGGLLAAHKSFWNVPNNLRTKSTITELIYVPDEIVDGTYILMLQIAPLESDASPSKPLLFPIQHASIEHQ